MRRRKRIQRGNPEQLSSSLAVVGGDNRRVDVKKTTLLEEGVNGESQGTAHTEDRSKSIGAWAQVGNRPQKFQGMMFFLQGIRGIGSAQKTDFLRLKLPLLACRGRGHNFSRNFNAGAGAQLLRNSGNRRGACHNHLHRGKAGTVVQFQENNFLSGANRPDPSTQTQLLSFLTSGKDFPDGYAAIFSKCGHGQISRRK